MAKDFNFGTSVETLTTIITAIDTVQTALKKQRAEHIEALREQHAEGMAKAAAELERAALAAAGGGTQP